MVFLHYPNLLNEKVLDLELCMGDNTLSFVGVFPLEVNIAIPVILDQTLHQLRLVPLVSVPACFCMASLCFLATVWFKLITSLFTNLIILSFDVLKHSICFFVKGS